MNGVPTRKEGVYFLPESPFPFNIMMGVGKQEAEHMGVRAKGEMLPKGERYDRPWANKPNLMRS